MSRKDDRLSFRNLIGFINKNNAALLESRNDVLVVNNLLANINRRTIVIKGFFNGDNGSVNASAITARRSQQNSLLTSNSSGDVR